MDNDYNIESSENITDWMLRPTLLPVKDNFDKLLKGFLETPGRMVQPSYNFYVILSDVPYLVDGNLRHPYVIKVTYVFCSIYYSNCMYRDFIFNYQSG